jgi:hypothetical protein
MPSNIKKYKLARSPSPAKVASPRKTSQRKKTSPISPSSPQAKVATRRRSPSPSAKVASPISPSSPQAKVATPKRSPSPQAKVASPKRRSPYPSAKVATRRINPSQRAPKDQYRTPFWPPSDYSVPAKVVINSTNPLPRTLAKHKLFMGELSKILVIEKIIDRENPLFAKLLAEQQEWNHRFYNLKPYKIVCFIKCDYYLHDKKAHRVFHRNNHPNPYFGNFDFLKLLEKNNMGVKRLDNNILYIHENRF